MKEANEKDGFRTKSMNGVAVRSADGTPIRYPVEPHGDRSSLPRNLQVVSHEAGNRVQEYLSESRLQRAVMKRAVGLHQKGYDYLSPEDLALMDKEGYKGWVVGYRFKDGATEEIPVVARDSQEALEKSKVKMNQAESQVDELIIVDPSLSEVLHKMGAGAKKLVASGVQLGKSTVEGAKIVGHDIGEAGGKVIETYGKARAIPEKMHEAYERGRYGEQGRSPDITPMIDMNAVTAYVAQNAAKRGKPMPNIRTLNKSFQPYFDLRSNTLYLPANFADKSYKRAVMRQLGWRKGVRQPKAVKFVMQEQ